MSGTREGAMKRARCPDGVPACACCGETMLVFLTLDHEGGNGAEARRAAESRGGITYYRRLVREGFPPGYQVLCWNCNLAKHLLGACPHQGDPR
jgi:hypothetical protein